MKIGRIILTHRQDLIPDLKKFYLPSRTDFLVIAYDENAIKNPEQFAQEDNFKLVPYPTDPIVKLDGLQFRVWVNVIKKFPQIEAWVVHDYDLIARPSDKEIFSRVGEKEYGMVGSPFPVWVPGIKQRFDTYPFPQGDRYWCTRPGMRERFTALVEHFPAVVDGQKTFYGGYGDFLAARSEVFLLMDDPRLDPITVGGNEQVEHTVWIA